MISPNASALPPDAPPKTSRDRRIVLSPLGGIVVVVLTLLVGVGIGLLVTHSFASDTSAALEQAHRDIAATQRADERLQERNLLLYDQVQTLQQQLEAATGESSVTSSAPAESGTYTDGTHRVGEDMLAGTYRGTVTGSSGYWARLKSTTGTFSSIITNGIPRGDFVLTIYPSDAAVELRGVVLTGPE